MKILFVAPWIPSAERPRSRAILEMLTDEHEVRFLGLASGAAEAAAAGALPAPAVTVANPARRALARTARGLATGLPLQQAYADAPRLRRAFDATLHEWQPDVIHLNVFRTAHLADVAPERTVIDLDEFRSEYYEQLSHGESAKWRLVGRIEAPRMRRREDALVASRATLLVSAPPAEQPYPANVHVVRSAVPLGAHALPVPHRPVVLFVGRMSYEANVAGLRWFVRHCWAAIHAANPSAVLRIVGASPPDDVLAWESSGSGIEIHANVPDVSPHYADATVCVAPIFRGTGVQLKVLQGLACSVPSVTTSDVARRAGTVDGVELLTADAPQEWISAVGTLLRDAELAGRVAAAGRDWVDRFHSPAAVREQLRAAYESALSHI